MNSNEDPLANFSIPRNVSTNGNDSVSPVKNVVDDLYETEPESHKRYRSNMINSLNNQPSKESSALKRSYVASGAGNTYKRFFIHDSTLPAELLEQFQPLYCKLCSIQLTSNIMAKLHYQSKNHDKKVKKFLIDYSERTGEPLHKRAKEGSKEESSTEEQDAKNYYCSDCDLQLTGKMHAQSHYMGKNHQRVVSGRSAPTGFGSYDVTGKWVRRLPNASKNEPGSDNFGLAFRTEQNVSTQQQEQQQQSNSGIHCDICNIIVTSANQMSVHISGTKHQKQLKSMGMSDNADNLDVQLNTDFSAYRTPSGSFYCNPCNTSTNSETQFKQHLESKKHKKKVNPYQ